MLKEFAQFIIDQARPDTVEFEGRRFLRSKPHEFKEECVSFSTLDGLCEFLKTRTDKFAINVSGPDCVEVLSEMDSLTKSRTEIAKAESIHDFNFAFGRYIESDDFLIELYAQFVETAARADLLQFCSKVEEVHKGDNDDDGISQTATVRKGIASKENVKIKNPVTLQPFRSFPEIEQVDCQFVFRMKGSGTGQPSFMLKEAGGSHWKIEAVKRIKTYLAKELPKALILA